MELITSRVVKESDLGTHGNLFGGKLLSWLDEAGGVLAAQVVDSPRVVTVKFGEITFSRKVKVNRLVKIYGEIIKIGRTSVTLRLEARRHNPYSGEQKVITSNEIVFVKIDEDGEPEPISSRTLERHQPKMIKDN
jgi:acyl-CoA thioesterase YciA